MKKYFYLSLLLFILIACASPRAVLWHGENATPSTTAAQNAAIIKPSLPKAIVPVFVATSRKAQANYSQPFGRDRSKTISYDLIKVGVPQEHEKGEVETNGYLPDMKKYFSAVSMQPYNNKQAYKQALNQALMKLPKGKREIFLFVHGYNNNYADGTFRAAQLAYDYNFETVNVHYSWPSGGALELYVYDRDSADFARDGLAELLTILSETNAEKITLVAHSMGSYVAMEALRTLSLKNKRKPIERISSLLLAAPDIDVDVFERQLNDIKKMPSPTIVLVSRSDKALAVSKQLTGGHPRVGGGADIKLLQDNGIIVVDLSNVDGGSHTVFASSPTLMALASDGSLANTIMKGTERSTGETILANSENILRGTGNLILYMPAHIISSIGQQ